MRVIVPLALEPEEFLAGCPDILARLVRDATYAGRAALDALGGRGGVFLVHDAEREALARGLPGAEAVPLPGAPPARVPADDLLPPFFRWGLDALPDDADGGTTLALDPRAPAPGEKTLAAAVRTLEERSLDLLFSARPPRDHPCQGKQIYSKDGGPNRATEGLSLCETENGILLRPETDCPEDALLLVRLRDARLLWLSPEAPNRTHATGFRLPPDVPADDIDLWMLQRPENVPGHGENIVPFAPKGAPWRRETGSHRVLDAATGCPVMGRQDFPEILVPDRNFSLHRNGALPRLAENSTEGSAPFAHDPAGPALIGNDLDVLAWELSREGGPKGLA